MTKEQVNATVKAYRQFDPDHHVQISASLQWLMSGGTWIISEDPIIAIVFDSETRRIVARLSKDEFDIKRVDCD
jgi:hypothetical protein